MGISGIRVGMMGMRGIGARNEVNQGENLRIGVGLMN